MYAGNENGQNPQLKYELIYSTTMLARGGHLHSLFHTRSDKKHSGCSWPHILERPGAGAVFHKAVFYSVQASYLSSTLRRRHKPMGKMLLSLQQHPVILDWIPFLSADRKQSKYMKFPHWVLLASPRYKVGLWAKRILKTTYFLSPHDSYIFRISFQHLFCWKSFI